MAAYADLGETLDDALLEASVDVPKHKTLKEHLWCVVGARESYAEAIAVGSWQGFHCSMQSFDTTAFRKALATSASAVSAAVAQVDDWTADRAQLLTGLAEHEVMHEGQIIRHMYALERELPESWTWA